MNKNFFESERPYKTYLSKDTLIDESQVGFFFSLLFSEQLMDICLEREEKEKKIQPTIEQ